MKIFKKKSTQKVSSGEAAVFSASRSHDVYEPFDSSMEHWEKELYDRLRYTVPVIDAAISKIVRLTGGYKIQCRDESMQEIMDCFSGEIPVGLTGHSIQSFTAAFLKVCLPTETPWEKCWLTVKLCSLPPFTTVIRQKLQFCRETVLSCLFTALKILTVSLKLLKSLSLFCFLR